MVKNKAGEMVPDFAADGKGKMMYGGMAKKKKKLRCSRLTYPSSHLLLN